MKAGDGVRGPECQSVGRTHLSSGLTPLSRFGTCGGLFATAGGDRHQERAHADPSAQRKLDRGAGRGQPTPRVPRSHHHPRRTASEHRARRVRRLLQPRSTTPDLGTRNSDQQCPLAQWRSSLSPDPRRSTSRLRTCRLMRDLDFCHPTPVLNISDTVAASVMAPRRRYARKPAFRPRRCPDDPCITRRGGHSFRPLADIPRDRWFGQLDLAGNHRAGRALVVWFRPKPFRALKRVCGRDDVQPQAS